jgi:N6-adenosine-specific RNA methylase IME4
MFVACSKSRRVSSSINQLKNSLKREWGRELISKLKWGQVQNRGYRVKIQQFSRLKKQSKYIIDCISIIYRKYLTIGDMEDP